MSDRIHVISLILSKYFNELNYHNIYELKFAIGDTEGFINIFTVYGYSNTGLPPGQQNLVLCGLLYYKGLRYKSR